MRSALSMTLIVCVVASALPLTAQEQTPVSFETPAIATPPSTTATGAIARAAMREAARLGTARKPVSPGLELVQPGDEPARSDWSRVVSIDSGEEVLLTVRRSKPARCIFVQADESALIVRTGRWQVVQTIARGDVQEIRTGRSGRRRALGLLGGLGGAIGGAFGGALVGVMVGGCDEENLGCIGVGMMAGVVGGSVLGYRAVSRTKGRLIYRAS